MSLFGSLATEIFQILKGNGKVLTLYTEDGNQIFDPEDARRMFVNDDSMMISIMEDGLDSSVNMYLSDIDGDGDAEGNEEDGESLKALAPLIDSLRNIATRHNVLFNVRNYGKELSPRDFAFQAAASKKIKEGNEMADELIDGGNLAESKMPKMTGTAKTSYQKIGSAKVIVRHDTAVNENVIGGRTRNIRAIFIETQAGERFKFPFLHVDGARALARHLSEGGTMKDRVAKNIFRLSEEFSNIRRVSNHIRANRATMSEAAMEIRGIVRSRGMNIKNSLMKLVHESSYAVASAKIKANPYRVPLAEGEIGDEVSRLAGLLNIMETDELFSALKYASFSTAGKAPLTELDDQGYVPGPVSDTPPTKTVDDNYTKYAEMWLGKNKEEFNSGDVANLANGLRNVVVKRDAGVNAQVPKVRYTDPTAELRHKIGAYLDKGIVMRNDALWSYINYLGDKLTNDLPLSKNEQYFAHKLAELVTLREGMAEALALEDFYDAFTPERFLAVEAPESVLQGDMGSLGSYAPGKRNGLEGPFKMANGRTYYYDVKEGQYYDPSTDLYVPNDEVAGIHGMSEAEDSTGKSPLDTMLSTWGLRSGSPKWDFNGETQRNFLKDLCSAYGLDYDNNQDRLKVVDIMSTVWYSTRHSYPELIRAFDHEAWVRGVARAGVSEAVGSKVKPTMDDAIERARSNLSWVDVANPNISTLHWAVSDAAQKTGQRFDSIVPELVKRGYLIDEPNGSYMPYRVGELGYRKPEEISPEETVESLGGDQGDDFKKDIAYDPDREETNPFADKDADDFYNPSMGEDMSFEDDPAADTTCPGCGAHDAGTLMGYLGGTPHYRCRDCGSTYSTEKEIRAEPVSNHDVPEDENLMRMRELAGLK